MKKLKDFLEIEEGIIFTFTSSAEYYKIEDNKLMYYNSNRKAWVESSLELNDILEDEIKPIETVMLTLLESTYLKTVVAPYKRKSLKVCKQANTVDTDVSTIAIVDADTDYTYCYFDTTEEMPFNSLTLDHGYTLDMLNLYKDNIAQIAKK